MSRIVEPPKIDVRKFPYHRQWTAAELDGIYERFEKLRTVLTDVVGPSGQVLYIDPGTVAILALHGALAGVDVHDGLAFIEYRIRSDEYGLFENVHEWRVKGGFDPDDTPPDSDITKRKAAQLREQLRNEVDPHVLDELKRGLAEEFTAQNRPRIDEEG